MIPRMFKMRRACHIWLLIFAICGFGGQSSAPRTEQDSPKPKDVAGAVDPDLELVRAWLKENLDDPHWEEVRWWHAREVRKSKIGRLKYRTKNKNGATQLYDRLFVFLDGKAYVPALYGPEYEGVIREFPE